MRDYTEQNPQFASTIRILESKDPGTAESVNTTTKQLLQNDLYLKDKLVNDKNELSNLIGRNKTELKTQIDQSKTEILSNLNTMSDKLQNLIFYQDSEPDSTINSALRIG